MTNIENRLAALEHGGTLVPTAVIMQELGESKAQAQTRYESEHGKIPDHANVVLLVEIDGRTHGH